MKQIKQTTMNVGNHKKHVLSKLFKTTKNSWNMKLQLKYIFRVRPYLTMLSAIAPQISLLSSQQMISIMLFLYFLYRRFTSQHCHTSLSVHLFVFCVPQGL